MPGKINSIAKLSGPADITPIAAGGMLLQLTRDATLTAYQLSIMIPRVVITGRPNVGKSTLFNRLVGARLALVADTPGVTRDRKEAETTLAGTKLLLVDTAGLEEAAPETLPGRMRASTGKAVDEADLVLFVFDARSGLLPEDRHFATWLRRTGKPVLVVANKAEGRGGAAATMEAYELGLGDPVGISAEHNEGVYDLMREIADLPAARRPRKRKTRKTCRCISPSSAARMRANPR